jgi:glycosyltransferase involved in cell wall biosynthesis
MTLKANKKHPPLETEKSTGGSSPERKLANQGSTTAQQTERISLVVCTLNEESNIADCISSASGVDEIVVADDGSTDATVQIAKSIGARIFRRRDWSIKTTQEDVKKFVARFGWEPAFTDGYRIRNGHLEAREGIGAASNDWVLSLDADERVTWDLPRLKTQVLPNADQVSSQFVHSHNADGTPTRVSTINKLFRKSLALIDARVHTCLIPTGRIVETDLMRIDHYQKPGHTQPYVLAILEYSVLADDDQRSRFYLGREYYYQHQYDRALTLLNLYLTHATWQKEIAQARLYAARCYWESGRGDQARESCLQAVLLNPEHKEALQLMSELYFEPWSHKWRHHAEVATDEDILF